MARGRKTEKKNETITLQAVKGVKGFQKKSKGAEIIKQSLERESEKTTRQIQTIEGLLPTEQILRSRDRTLELIDKATTKLFNLLDETSNPYVIIHIYNAAIKWGQVVTPRGILETEETHKKFGDIPQGEGVFGDVEMKDYSDKGVEIDKK